MRKQNKVSSHIRKRKEEYLPVKLINKFNEEIFNNNNYDYRSKNNFLKCIGIIYYKQTNEYYALNDFVSTGSAYWKKVFGGEYHRRVIDPLLELKIIQSYDYGFRSFPDKNKSSNKGKTQGIIGIRYQINLDLIAGDCGSISYINKGKVITVEELVINNGYEFNTYNGPVNKLRVSIDQEEALKYVEEHAEEICRSYMDNQYINHLPDNLQIEFHEQLQEGSYNKRYSTVSYAKQWAVWVGMELFYFKDKFYIANPEEFLQQRIEKFKYTYKREILKVGVLPIIDNRSTVTLRLHNYLVNFPSKILKFITINNKTLVQLDLQTSQFLLLANLMNSYINHGEEHLLGLFTDQITKTYLKKLIKVLKQHQLPSVGVNINDKKSCKHSNSDVIRFIRDVFFKDFYNVVKIKLNLPTRGIAKQMLFKMIFRMTNRPDALVDKLKILYPDVMSIIAEFKKNTKEMQFPDDQPKSIVKYIKKKNKSRGNRIDEEDHESNLSVFLQRVEAEIFIDKILMQLRIDKIPCFTRHDSIVFASGYEDSAMLTVKAVFARLGFKYNHKVEDMFYELYDYSDLEESGYMDHLIDVSTLDDTNAPFDGYEIRTEVKLNTVPNQTEVALSVNKTEDYLGEKNELAQKDSCEEGMEIAMLKDFKNAITDYNKTLRSTTISTPILQPDNLRVENSIEKILNLSNNGYLDNLMKGNGLTISKLRCFSDRSIAYIYLTYMLKADGNEWEIHYKNSLSSVLYNEVDYHILRMFCHQCLMLDYDVNLYREIFGQSNLKLEELKVKVDAVFQAEEYDLLKIKE